MSKPASTARLGGLHAQITALFEKTVAEWFEPTEATLPPTAADIGVIVKFLKDNDITADPGDNEALDSLRDKLEALKKKERSASIMAAASNTSMELQ